MDRETKPSQTPRPQPPRQPRARIPLPFEKRPFDAGSWAYEHRVGLCCMVIAYLAFGIVFVSAKIVLQQRVTYNTIYMDLTDLQAALPEEQEPEQRDERSDYRDVRNLVSDENGRNESGGARRRETFPKRPKSSWRASTRKPPPSGAECRPRARRSSGAAARSAK